MGAKFSAFTSLIEPMSADEFFANYWEKQPLYIRRENANFYKDLITLDNVQSAISFGGLRYPAIQLSKSGAFLHPDVFCTDIRSGDIVFNGVPDLDKLQAEYKSGATLSLPGFNRAWQPLMTLAAAVEDYLNHAVHTNIYITPGNAAGFTPHYDAHEVFILQISGTKHWQIFEPPLNLPHRTQTFQPQMLSDALPIMELNLQPGDLLYLPRGFVHAANALEKASMHVTLGVTVYTYVELMTAWLQSSKNELAIRKALPPGFANHLELQAGIESELSGLIAEFNQKLDAKQLVNSFFQRVRKGYPGRNAVRQEIELNVSVINPGAKLKTMPLGLYQIAEDGENIVLKFGEKTMVMSKRAQPLLAEMCKRTVFQPAELPSDLKEETKLTLIRHLYQEGFLILCE
jgi:ribosomal protein L16 Arg81 hydroxylase